jgi:hypothetical protein
MPIGNWCEAWWGSPERLIQLTEQFSDTPTATRGDRVAPQDVHHDGMRKDPRLRDVVGSDGGIVSGGSSNARAACAADPPGVPPTRVALGSGGQVERAREAVEEVATTAQHLDHARRDRAIRGELARDEPMDARTRGEG